MDVTCISDLYPNGTLWQDERSLGEDELVDTYIMNDTWQFLGRFRLWI